MFDRWFRRGASASAVCVNSPVADDTAELLHDAERRIAQLEALLQQSVIELDRYRELAAAPVAAAVPAKVAKPKAAKPKLGALEFWRIHSVAVANITAEFGSAWKVNAPIGRTVLVTLAACYRSCKTERGVTLRWSRDARIPAAEYWPGAAYPEGVEVLHSDYAREHPILAKSATGPVTPIGHDAAWHIEHGYVLHNGIWVSEILLRSQLDHQEWILAEREAKRLQALERAALSYGPQPFADVMLWEAAD